MRWFGRCVIYSVLCLTGGISIWFLEKYSPETNAVISNIKDNSQKLWQQPFYEVFDGFYQKKLDATFRKRATGFRVIFSLLAKQQFNRPIIIVETGSLRNVILNLEGDGASTFLFNHFLQGKEGQVFTVDLDPVCKDIIDNVFHLNKVQAYTMDSIKFLNEFSQPENISLLYLDSYDVDWDFPEPAALHHLKEVTAIFDKLSSGTIIVVDDNLVLENKKTGKGYLVERFLKERGVPLLYDGYQKIFQIPVR